LRKAFTVALGRGHRRYELKERGRVNRCRGRMEHREQGRKPQQIVGHSVLFVDG